METLEGTWGLLGIIIVALLLILALFKKVSWKAFGITAAVYVVVLIALGEIVLANPSMQTPEKRIFSIIANKDDRIDGDLMFDTDEKGNYVLKLKGTGDGQATVSTDEDKVIKTVDIHKGKVSKVKIHMPAKEDEYDLTVTDNGNHSKSFTLMNDSDANLAENTDDGDSDESKSSSKKYSNGKDVAKALNDAAANDPRLNGLHVTYKDSIFYVNIPTEITQTDDNTQKSVYRNVARTLHGYQKSPTGVIYFEDEEGNVVATTKVLNNNDVKLK